MRNAYDLCGSRYAHSRMKESPRELLALIDLLPEGATVLDIGCGAGIPITSALARVATVVGVDISSAQIELARHNVPEATFAQGDIMAMEFEPASFDAIVAFYALFHLPREEHRTLLERVARWLRPCGHLLATLAVDSHPGYTESDFFGVTMFWSHYEPEWYRAVLHELGFEMLAEGICGHGYDPASGLPPERHPFVLAQLRP